MLGYAIVTVVLFAFGRINEFGLVLAYDPRYVEDLFVVGAMVLPFAFRRPIKSPLSEPRRLDWAVFPGRRLAGAVGMLVLANALLLPSIAIGSSWHDSEAKRYVATARAALESSLGTPVLDRKVPPGVMAPLFLERANASYVLGGLDLPVAWNAAGPSVLALGDDGSTLPPVLAPSSTSVPGWDGACGWRVADASTPIELDTTLFEWVWVGRMEYLASGPGVVRARFDGPEVEIPVAEGLHSVDFVIVGSGDTLRLDPPSGVGLCVAKVALAQVDYGAMGSAS
jgi:hypothetical protein